jgi:hypothetical protein
MTYRQIKAVKTVVSPDLMIVEMGSAEVARELVG